MAITGTHMLLYSSEAEALRSMLSKAFGFESVDAGGGWLIFAQPPAELAVHPGEGPTFESGMRHESHSCAMTSMRLSPICVRRASRLTVSRRIEGIASRNSVLQR